MSLVAFDTNIIDEFAGAIFVNADMANTMEALDEPPAALEPTMRAMYWIVALSRFWRSYIFTFSDRLYAEVNDISDSRATYRSRLLELAAEIREGHSDDCVRPDIDRCLAMPRLGKLGLKSADAEHVADAIGLRASHFLTLDRGILKRAPEIRRNWGLRILTPEQFLILAVRNGASWPTNAPWPWEAGLLTNKATSRSGRGRDEVYG